MTCFECKSEMTESTTTYVKELGNCLVIIRNVPCYKCAACGGKAYTAEVLLRVEEIVDSFRKVVTEFAVVNFTAA